MVGGAAMLAGSVARPSCRRHDPLTVSSQLGIDYNAAMLDTIARKIAPALGWRRRAAPEPVG
jgi:hypothetical protein